MNFKKIVSIGFMILIGLVLGGFVNVSLAQDNLDDVEILSVENDKLREQLLEEDKQLQIELELKIAQEKAKEFADKKAAEELAKKREAEELAKKKEAEELVKKKEAEELAKKREAEELANKKEEEKLAAENRKLNTFYMESTAYVAFYDTGCTGITATGLDVRSTITYQGLCIIAVDPNVISLGSKVLVNGTECVAADTGGAIKGNRIDILVGSVSEAVNYGRKSNIEVIKIGEVNLP